MTIAEKLDRKREAMAEEYALNVEWKGTDYGERKMYYRDCHREGSASLREQLLKAVELVEVFYGFCDTYCRTDSRCNACKAKQFLEQFDAWLDGGGEP